MKRGSNIFRLFSHIAILVLILIMAVASTFSWYDRTEAADEEGNLLNYTISGTINNISGGEITTYKGDNDNGRISYTTEISGSQTVTIPSKDDVCYYKTVITNSANNGASMVSLYLKSITAEGGKAYIGIFTPEKTYAEATVASATAVCIEDNLVLPNKGTIEVYWYVGADAAATVTFGDLYLVYN